MQAPGCPRWQLLLVGWGARGLEEVWRWCGGMRGTWWKGAWPPPVVEFGLGALQSGMMCALTNVQTHVTLIRGCKRSGRCGDQKPTPTHYPHPHPTPPFCSQVGDELHHLVDPASSCCGHQCVGQLSRPGVVVHGLYSELKYRWVVISRYSSKGLLTGSSASSSTGRSLCSTVIRRVAVQYSSSARGWS